ncbi:MAG: leucine-rich repeat domain-containing protein, partial [Prevotella sp.]|nr:leucine-rich repeat domain-containing protein [Prevotella sp.]
CISLTSVTLNSVEYITFRAFQGCRSLTSVTLPSSVKEIGSYAFYGSKLSTIVSLIEDPIPIVGKGQIWSTFSDDTFTKATLYVPAGSVEKYKTTYGWKDFGHIVPLDEGMSVKVMESDNDSPSKYFLLNGQQVEKPQKGLNIVKIGDKAIKVLMK